MIETSKTWLDELFEYEWCEECGGGAEDHVPNLVMGNWFAWCKHPIPEHLSDEEHEAELNARYERKDNGLPLIETE